MNNWLNKKISILKYEAKNSNSSIVSIFAIKFLKFSLRVTILILDLFVLLLLSPVLVIAVLIFLLFRGDSRNKKNIFFIGLEHVIDKTAHRAIWMEENGFRSFFFSFEWSGMRCNPSYHPEIIKYSHFVFYDVLIFFRYLLKYRPMYLEVYFEGNGYRQFFSCMLARIFNILTIIIDRGIYYNDLHYNIMPYLFKKTMINSIKISDYVFYRDPPMINFFKKFKIKNSKLILDYNKVKINPIEPSYKKSVKHYKVLFLNGFIRDRNLELLVKTIPFVVSKIPNVSFELVGARNEIEAKRVQNIISDLKVENYANVHYWAKNPADFFNNCHVYVFPAKYVFCNFSLLEAMERGLPAIVSRVEDADRIVEHGINGYLCNLEVKDFADKIVQVLSDDVLRIQMGIEARKTMINKYDNSTRMNPILDLIYKKYF